MEKIWKGARSSKLPIEIQHAVRRKLRMLYNSITLIDLRIPPTDKLEKRAGNHKDYHSIRINDQ
ncbi:MAG: type II toxin-antitoxin system RelE/ParE family toxin [Bacteroidales bacterium]|nr:type II toxin-antitoxin system RelE/ParE family toxin [Bacteroidales bacterium]